MSKVLGSWSGMRKYLEQEMLADSLKGRVRYSCTSYPNMDDCKIFEIFIDGNAIKQFSWETVNTYFIQNNLKENNNPYGRIEYWQGFHAMLNKIPPEERTEYTDEEFCDALAQYRNGDIQTGITSPNPLVRMFAILDRRVGKRTLTKIKEEISAQPQWLQQLYILRFDAEGIR